MFSLLKEKLGLGPAPAAAPEPNWTDADPCAACLMPCEAPAASISKGMLKTISPPDEMHAAGVKPHSRHILFRGGQAKAWPGHLEEADGDSVGRVLVTAFAKVDAAPPRRRPSSAGSSAGELSGDVATAGSGAVRKTFINCIENAAASGAAAAAAAPSATSPSAAVATNDYDATNCVEVWCFPERLYFPHLDAAQVPLVAKAIGEYAAIPAGVAYTQFPTHPLALLTGTDPLARDATTPRPRFWIGICGHMKRDKRCGVIGPMLADTFRRQLPRYHLDGSVEVFLTSHYGGHKFAGNLIIFSTIDALNGVWYGRVTPECVQGIIEQTLLQGKVFQTLYRGRMNQQASPMQW